MKHRLGNPVPESERKVVRWRIRSTDTGRPGILLYVPGLAADSSPGLIRRRASLKRAEILMNVCFKAVKLASHMTAVGRYVDICIATPMRILKLCGALMLP